MNGKVVFGILSLLLLSGMSMFAFNPTEAQASSLPTISVNPSSIVDPSLTPGTSFSVDMRISDADNDERTDVYSWQVCLQWDPLVLDIDDTVVWGDFLDAPRKGWWGVLPFNAPAGQKEVEVASGSKYQVGYEVLIEDDSNSEWNMIAGVVGNTLTVMNNLAHTYAVSANAGCYPKVAWTPAININQEVGRIMHGQTTNGPAPGQSGDGWLSTLTFHVLTEEAETSLDIDSIFTYVKNDIGEKLGDEEGELNKESGFFSNISGTAGDIAFDGNIITVTGFTEDSPCTFWDLWNASNVNGWNIMWNNKDNDTQYQCDATRINIGDDSTATYFADSNVEVFFTQIRSNWQYVIVVHENAHFRLGVVEDEATKRTSQGCHLIFDGSDKNHYALFAEKWCKKHTKHNVIRQK